MATCASDDCDQLQEALLSVYDQQDMKPHEIIVVKDGPVDDQISSVLKEWHEKLPEVLKVLALPRRSGLAEALNLGLQSCSGEFIARMDSDDISYADRFLKQSKYLRENPDVSVCGSYVKLYTNNLQNSLGIRHVPASNDDIVNFAKWRCPMNHPSVMYRRSIFKKILGYPVNAKAQDYALWAKLILSGYKFGNIPEALVKMRMGKNPFQKRGFKQFIDELKILRYQRKIGFLNDYEYCRNVLVRLVARSIPEKLRQLVYSYSDKKVRFGLRGFKK